jgi:hypothetical protein
MPLSFKARIKLIAASILIKLGKLRHDDFTVEELDTLLSSMLPVTFPISIPVGEAKVSMLEGKIRLHEDSNTFSTQLLASLNITVSKTTVYRAHFIAVLSAKPTYDELNKTVSLTHVSLEHINLVNDEYALIGDTRVLLTSLLPGGVDQLLGRSLQNALNLMTIGTSDRAIAYAKIFLAGSKQNILDYHKPQITDAVYKELNKHTLSHTMRDNVWREVLFARYGKRVGIEHNRLRFYF